MQGVKSSARSNTKLGNSLALQLFAKQSLRSPTSATLPQFETAHDAIVVHWPQFPAAVASHAHKHCAQSLLELPI